MTEQRPAFGYEMLSVVNFTIMGLLIFFGIVILFMIADDIRIKKDIDAATKIKWTKKDAENYYKKFDEWQ
jgi:hypothetical protein